MKFFSKFLGIALATTLTVSSFVVPVSANEADTKTVTVLSINDFHGTLTETGEKDKNMGAAKLVSALNSLSDENVIIVSAGDNYNGSALSNLLYGAPVNDMFKNAGITLSAVGNHEFDWGTDKIKDWSNDGVEFLAANIVEKETGLTPDWATPYEIVDVNGVNVGFIGLTTPETAYKTTPAFVEDLTFLNPTEVATKLVPEVRDAGADVVILLSHIGSYQDADGNITFETDGVGLENAGADAIITAHSHKTVSGFVGETPVVQAYYNGRSVGTLDIELDENNEIISITPSVNELYKNKTSYEDDADTKTTVDGYLEEVAPILDKELGVAKTTMTRSAEELSPLGEWTANVMLEASGADIAATNAGGIRAEIEEGPITMGTMYTVMPFDNVNSVWEMKGSDIKDLFEYGFDNTINDPNTSFMQFAGVYVEYNTNGEKGNRVEKLTLYDGTEVQPDETYTVVTNDFMASGGDGYTMFSKGTLVSEADPIRDLMAEHVLADGGIDFTPKGLITYTSNENTEIAQPITDPMPVAEPVTDPMPVVKPATPEVIAPTNNKVVYTVVAGDNLSKIARKYNTTWQEIQKLNNLKNVNLIFPGEELLIPAA